MLNNDKGRSLAKIDNGVNGLVFGQDSILGCVAVTHTIYRLLHGNTDESAWNRLDDAGTRIHEKQIARGKMEDSSCNCLTFNEPRCLKRSQ